MGLLDRLFGQQENPHDPYGRQQPGPHPGYRPPENARPGMRPPASEDERAIERYRYLLRTAPPETIEQVHAEAFSKLTEAQRQRVLADLTADLPPAERPSSADPRTMARAATRAEYTNPGFMERTLGRRDAAGGPSFGSMVGSSILGTVAGYVIGSALVSSFLAPTFADGGAGDGGSDAGGADAGGADAAADPGLGDFGGDFGF